MLDDISFEKASKIMALKVYYLHTADSNSLDNGDIRELLPTFEATLHNYTIGYNLAPKIEEVSNVLWRITLNAHKNGDFNMLWQDDKQHIVRALTELYSETLMNYLSDIERCSYRQYEQLSYEERFGLV